MASHATTPPKRSASDVVREMRDRMAPRRERVLRNAERLREIAAARRGRLRG
jgi:hypothetical protein